MHTNGNRSASYSSTKRKFENGGNDDAGCLLPVKQHNYGDSLSISRNKQQSSSDNFNISSRATSSQQLNHSESHSSVSANSGRTASVKQNVYGDAARVAQNINAAKYGDSMNVVNKHHSASNQQTYRESSSSVKQYSSVNSIPYEALCTPPPPPPSQYSYTDNKASGHQYAGYKQDSGSHGSYHSPSYNPSPSRYGQHNGMMGQGRGWNHRGRPPMRGYQRNQWQPQGPPGPSGPIVHPHMAHPGHMVPPLLPPVPFRPPRGYYGGHLGPCPPPLFGHQGNQHGGRNQGSQIGLHSKSKNKKRSEEVGSTEVNILPTKTKGGILLSPDNKLVKGRKKNTLPAFPSRPWNRDDAEKALKVEVETTLNLKNESLIIRFPDPELSRDIVKSYHSGIMNVHFQVPSGPRYCFVQLAPDVNTEKVIKILENIKFGSGHLSVEKKSTKQEEEASPESIDPYTLYIGNLPTNVNIQTVKEKFPDAARVDVGFAQRMRYTRYAFIRFNSVDDAIKAYKENHNLVLDSRSIIVRFRRQKGQIDLPGESKPQQPPKVNVRTSDSKKKDEEKSNTDVKKKSKDEEDEEDEKDDDEDDDDEDEEDNADDDDDDDDDDDGEGEAEDDDDDDEEEEEGRKPLQDDDDDDDEDEVGGPSLPPDDDDEEDDVNIFRELDAQLGGYDGFPFQFN